MFATLPLKTLSWRFPSVFFRELSWLQNDHTQNRNKKKLLIREKKNTAPFTQCTPFSDAAFGGTCWPASWSCQWWFVGWWLWRYLLLPALPPTPLPTMPSAVLLMLLSFPLLLPVPALAVLSDLPLLPDFWNRWVMKKPWCVGFGVCTW
jgi:hypothetical protein